MGRKKTKNREPTRSRKTVVFTSSSVFNEMIASSGYTSLDKMPEIVACVRKIAELIGSAEAKSRELRKVASDYVDDIMRQSEESVSSALGRIQAARRNFQSLNSGASAARAEQENLSEE